MATHIVVITSPPDARYSPLRAPRAAGPRTFQSVRALVLPIADAQTVKQVSLLQQVVYPRCTAICQETADQRGKVEWQRHPLFCIADKQCLFKLALGCYSTASMCVSGKIGFANLPAVRYQP